MYARNHYFGLGPIPKPKPKLADTFGDMVTDTETTFQRENLDTDSMGYFFSSQKGPFSNQIQVLGLFLSF